MTRTIAILSALVASAAFFYGPSGPVTIGVGVFPNITHAQAMAGKANSWFEKSLGPNVKIEWMRFNAGPSAMEAMFAGAIDMAYIGPNPTISGYVRSQGEALRVVAGAASGGASLVVRNDSGINKPEDFPGAAGQYPGRRAARLVEGSRHDANREGWRPTGAADGEC